MQQHSYSAPSTWLNSVTIISRSHKVKSLAWMFDTRRVRTDFFFFSFYALLFCAITKLKDSSAWEHSVHLGALFWIKNIYTIIESKSVFLSMRTSSGVDAICQHNLNSHEAANILSRWPSTHPLSPLFILEWGAHFASIFVTRIFLLWSD